jgi:ATP-binding cassette, subfamily B, bacterial PglK
VRIDGVSHWYDGRPEPALSKIDLIIERGKCVAITGATGAGKTTLIDVILGLFEPTEGRILVDGIDIRTDLAGWQRLIGYVPQNPFLMDGTLRRNIAFGIRDADIDPVALEQAVDQAQLRDCIAGLPDGLDTLVGERGVRLSGGERQRLAIARALYRDPELIVFDEATSALDAGTEHALGRAMEALRGRKTLLIVAHRLSTVERADQVILLSQGRLGAIGTYGDLARSNSAFRSVAALDIT